MSQNLNRHVIVQIEPASEPVTASEFKTFTKVSGDDDDSLIDSLIKSARISIESYISKPIINTTYKQYQDYFDIDDMGNYSVRDQLAYVQDVDNLENKNAYIKLSKKPVVSITSIKTYDDSNNATTYNSSNYTLDIAGSKVIINDDATLPVDLRNRAAVEIVYISGFGATSSDIPDDIKTAIKMYVQSMYDFNRGAETLIAEAYTMPTGAKNLLNRYRDLRMNG